MMTTQQKAVDPQKAPKKVQLEVCNKKTTLKNMMPKRVIFFNPCNPWVKNHLPGDSSHEKFTFSLTIPKFGHVKTRKRQVDERVSEAEWCE